MLTCSDKSSCFSCFSCVLGSVRHTVVGGDGFAGRLLHGPQMTGFAYVTMSS